MKKRDDLLELIHHLYHISPGLRYQDLFIEDDAVSKAVHHLPPEEQVARYGQQ